MDNHFYAWYKGNLSNILANPTSDDITKCTFRDQDMYCYFNESNTPVNDGKFYYSKCRYGRMIIPINSEIKTQYEVEKSETKLSGIDLDNLGKGRYGCIPKFIKDGSNNLAFVTENMKKVITLHIARHDMINDINQTVLELEPHFFPISDDDYDTLNGWFTDVSYNFNIQGGVDDRSLCVLNVYDPLGKPLGQVNILPNPPHPNN